MNYYALVPAAGSGLRFGSETPKQYSSLNGKPVLQHSIERLSAGLPLTKACVVLARSDRWYEASVPAQTGVTLLRCGAASRAATIRNALAELEDVAEDDWILVHDAVRPCVDRESLSRLVSELADEPVGGLLAVPVSGALKRAGEDRRIAGELFPQGVWRAQTPQMFRFGVLREALTRPGAEAAGDEADAVSALGLDPKFILGSGTNIKITYAEDLTLAAAILDAEAEVNSKHSLST